VILLIKYKEIFTYEVVGTECKKRWKYTKEIKNVYDKLVDRRNPNNIGKIACGCCMPPKNIFVSIKEIKKIPVTN
jgi:hypothetical protein